MPVFQNAATLAAAAASILNQSAVTLELILVDDGSTDGGDAVIATLAATDPRVIPIRILHAGQIPAILAGAAVARAPMIARMDADDLARPDRLSRQLAWMAATGAQVCGGWARTFGVQERLIRFPSSPAAIAVEALFRSPLLDPTLVIGATVLRQFPYDPADRFLPDQGLILRLLDRASVTTLPAVILDYRQHPAQLSRRAALAVHQHRILRSRRHLADRWGVAESDPLGAIVVGSRPANSAAELEALGGFLIGIPEAADGEAALWLACRWIERCLEASPPPADRAKLLLAYAKTLISLPAADQAEIEALSVADCNDDRPDARFMGFAGAD
jgi:glycosyltransferase involved in cell wall biosynthesis